MLKDKGGMFAAISAMRNDYKKEAAVVQEKSEVDKAAKRASVEAIETGAKFRTTKTPKDTPERRHEAQGNLREEAERRAGKAGIDPTVVERELIAQQADNPHVVESEDLPGAPFFRCLQRGGQRVLSINRGHPFYEQLYMAPSSTPRTRAALEVLLWALGEAEVDAEPDTDRRRFYERERASAWSPYLSDALTALSTMSIVEDEPNGQGAEGDETAA
jgi:hypothetical protein